MNRLNQLLIAVLAAQLVVAGGIYYADRPPASGQIQTVVLDADTSRIDSITVVAEDGEQTRLDKVDGRWLLPGYHGLPASATRVAQALEQLAASRLGWPVATTASGRERFQVGADNFHKKIVLAGAGETLQTLYLGTSPGIRQVHLRRDGEDEVYAVSLDSYEIAPRPERWLDASLLQPGAEVTALRGPDFALEKSGDEWRVSAGDGEPVAEEIDNLASALMSLRVREAADIEPAEIEYELRVGTADSSLGYRFFTADDDHYVQRDDYAQAFRINEFDYEAIVGKGATELVRVTPPDAGEPKAGVEESDPVETSKTGEEVMRNDNS